MADPRTLDWRRLAKRLATFAAVALALDAAIGAALGALLPHVHAGQRVGVVNNAIDAEADVVILGSSYAMHSYDDEALSRRLGMRVHNAGLDGRGILFARGVLALIRERRAPRHVVLDMTYADDSHANAYALAPWYGRSEVVDALLVEGDWRERVKLASRSFRMNSVAISIVGNFFVARPAWGYAPVGGRLDPATPRDAKPPRPNANPAPFVEAHLTALVEDARRDGATVVFAESPTFGDPRPADVRALYARVAERLGVPWIRLSDAELASYGPELFRDRGHLNRDGAARYTEWVGERLARAFSNGDSRKSSK